MSKYEKTEQTAFLLGFLPIVLDDVSKPGIVRQNVNILYTVFKCHIIRVKMPKLSRKEIVK